MHALESRFILALWLFSRISVRAWEIRPYPSSGGRSENEIELDEPTERIDIIFPGTKWCGSGNIASNPDDLGKYSETDACCRNHDMCPDVIEAHGTKHGLTNPSFYTRLNCSCDDEFHRCLKNSKDGVGGKVGTVYFTLLGTQCFREDYPVVGCKSSTLTGHCLKYEFDTTKPKKYQWFDVPSY
ncbi:phospholipase A2-like [Frieseomelitta varia]|uniref:phospholipase A2-like n=1 Tax=Frieseomelitta varia TaxID=561572 RepID=UPI001CB6799D|nr:phospholipase A2-like [Frieseomelitta varia]